MPKTPRECAVVIALSLATSVAAPSVHAQPSETSSRPWLGVAMEAAGNGSGILVSHVIHGSPAERAGLREGDRIVRVDAQPVRRSEDVIHTVAFHSVGEWLEVQLLRDGASQQRRVMLAEFPSPQDLMKMDLIGRPAPRWRDLQSVGGALPASLAALQGRVVLLDFWATWCGPCRLTMPTLGGLQTRYGAQGLSVLGITTEDPEEVASFTQQTATVYATAVDKRGETTRSYGVFSLPTLVVIDKRGTVRDVIVGYDPSEDSHLDATVRRLLAEVTSPSN